MPHADQPKEKEKPTMSVDDVSRFVHDFRYPLEGERPLSCCVDGRMVESDELTPAARPGADAGDLMVVIAALRALGVEEIEFMYPELFAVVADAAGGAERFRFHTDEHAMAHSDSDRRKPYEIVARGCGHLKQAEMDPHAYGLEAHDMAAIFVFLVTLRVKGAKEVILKGEHGEGGVLVVESETFGVRHGDGKGRQTFVYHAALDRKRLEELAHALWNALHLKKSGLDQEHLLAALASASDRQRGETLIRLAKGLPVYKATEDGVTFVGNV